MKTARWWPAAILLLGLAVLGANGRPNKEGFRSPPYRPVVRFRHKVLIAVFFSFKGHCAFSKYRTYHSGAFYLHQTTLVVVIVVFLPTEMYLVNHYRSLCADCLFKDCIRLV